MHLKATRERGRERERFVHQRFSVFWVLALPPLSCHRREKKEEGIWFHPTLLPFQRCCSGSLVRAGGWGSVKLAVQTPLPLLPEATTSPPPLLTSLQEHHQHTGTHKWVRCNAVFLASNLENAPKIASGACAHLDGLE